MNNDTPSAPQYGQPEQPNNQGYPPGMPQYPPPPPNAGYPQGGYPPPGQPGQPAPGGYYLPENHPQATTILVLGILSLVCCGLLGPVAWIMGGRALREIDSNPGRYGGRSQISAGRICGIIGTALTVLLVLVYGAIVALAISSGDASFTVDSY